MSETFDYLSLDSDEKDLFEKLIQRRGFYEYSALMTYITNDHIVVSALFPDETPENPLEEWMTDIEIVTNVGGRNSIGTDDEGRFNLESGIVDIENFPDWTYYNIDIWTDEDGEDIEGMEDIRFPYIGDFANPYDHEVHLETIDKYVEHVTALRDSLGDNIQDNTIECINDYIKDVLDYKESIAPNPHAYTGRFDGGYYYGWIDAIVIPSDSLVEEFLGYGDDGAQKLQNYLKSCLETYGYWARGEVYGYNQYAYLNGEEVAEDYCWGYYGDDAEKELKEVHESLVARQEEKQKRLDEIRAMFLPESELVNA